VSAAEDRGLTIMEDRRRINSGYRDELVLYKMVLVNSKGDRSERSLELRTLEGPEAGDKTLLIFKDPPDVRGTTLLTHEKPRGRRRPVAVPAALRRSRRIGSSNISNSFAGSELAYEDLAPNEVTKRQYKYLREEALDGVPVWVMTVYGKLKLFIEGQLANLANRTHPITSVCSMFSPTTRAFASPRATNSRSTLSIFRGTYCPSPDECSRGGHRATTSKFPTSLCSQPLPPSRGMSEPKKRYLLRPVKPSRGSKTSEPDHSNASCLRTEPM